MALMEWEFSSGPDSDGQFMATGKVIETLRRHLAKGEVDLAVSLYESCVQETVGAQIWSEFGAASTTMKKTIANLFYRARDYQRAGKAAEALGEWGAAARAYASAYEWPKAAECLIKGGDKAKAAQAFEKAGQPRKAAEIYFQTNQLGPAAVALESAGDFLGAGQLFIRTEDFTRAAQALAKVPKEEPRYLSAVAMLGETLLKLGRRDLAIQRLGAVIAPNTRILDPLMAELAYRLGRLLLEENQFDSAQKVLELVHAFNPAYKETAATLEAIRRGQRPGAPPTPSIPTLPAITLGGKDPLATQSMRAVQVPAAATDPFAALDGNFSVAEPKSAPTVKAADPATLGYVQRMDGYEALKKLPIFDELSLEEMKAFYQLAEHVSYAPGEVIIEQGHPGGGLIIVREGALEVSKIESGGKKTVLATLPAGKYVGEMSLIDDVPTSARVTAAQPVKALKLRKDRFEQLLFSHDRIALRVYRSFVRTLSERLRQQNAKA